MESFFSRLILVFFLTATQLCSVVNLHAQDGYFLDAFEEVTFIAPAFGHTASSRYLYNKDYKLGKIISDSRIILYIYEDKKTTREVRDTSNFNLLEKLETTYNDDDQLIQNVYWRNSNIEYIDSFFYKNERLHIKKAYETQTYGTVKLISTDSYEYTDIGLLACHTYTEYEDYFNDMIDNYTKEVYQYDEQMNLVFRIETYSSNPDKIYYDSTTYSYNEDLELRRKENVTGSYTSLFTDRTFSLYSYRENKKFESKYRYEWCAWRKVILIETNYTPNEFYDFDTIITYAVSNGLDKTRTKLETNQLIYSSTGDSLIHRYSESNFDVPLVLSQYVSKKIYKKHPQLINHAPEQIEDLKIYPNPVNSNRVIKIPSVKFDYDKVVIYNINNGKMHSIKADRNQHYFNAPRESGMYLVQLWNKNLPVTEVAKVIVQ